jgi:hypothetical protein
MGTTGQDSLIEIPRDDGGIGAALGDLERRIALWTSAITAVHTALVGHAAKPPAQAEPAPRKIVQLPASDRQATTASAPAAEKAPAEDATGYTKRLKKHLSAPQNAAGDVERFAYQDGSPPVVEKSTKAQDDDEALLATLDPKKARAIRIKRRLSNNTKSVRELLDEK